ncbi:uncharacterized protein DNG_02620 [Cephalotrichum gorgonifer]|uniref:Nucleoside phosphorylase domain-containing protein n=1 Tax=Cephalotrichum gorgonifer TaxID=2041049 RepID=A0AAE8MVE9_9PEZI|nr:uncharacterized protein DNG_02620 [Cephalotrichum gorgonifer]
MGAVDQSLLRPKSLAMGEALHDYIFQRVHQDIQRKEWREILVTGSLRRGPPAAKSLWETERPGRAFNFQRPTATCLNDDTIELHCFPSQSFVEHYKTVLDFYLFLSGKSGCILRAIPPPPSEPLETFRRSNLPQLGPVDIVIVGEVHCLPGLPPGSWWKGRDIPEEDLFAWEKYPSPTGKTITLLGCKEGLWGEAAGAIIHALKQMSDVQCALYVGKVGALTGEYAPNEWIATGSEVLLRPEDRPILWKNPLEDVIRGYKGVVASGELLTVASPLCETKEWLQQRKEWLQQRSESATWVDCDTGHMAAAAKDVSVQFGYLHIVSDNLAAKYKGDLSNEDCVDVTASRSGQYRKIENIISDFASSWDTAR